MKLLISAEKANNKKCIRNRVVIVCSLGVTIEAEAGMTIHSQRRRWQLKAARNAQLAVVSILYTVSP